MTTKFPLNDYGMTTEFPPNDYRMTTELDYICPGF